MEKFQIEPKQCINHFKNSKCQKCLVICPQQAIENDHIDMNKCNACGLCLSVCPAKAVSASIPYREIIEQYSKQKKISFRCRKQHEKSAIPCLAFLEERLLFAMAQRHEIEVDLSACESCGLRILDMLKMRVAKCNTALTGLKKPLVQIIERGKGYDEQQAAFDRRSFLKQVVGTAVSFFEFIYSDASEERCLPCDFDEYIKEEVDKTILQENALFFSCFIRQSCNACGLCTMVCPRKALNGSLRKDTFILTFDKMRCHQCHVCENNCAQNSLLIAEEWGEAETFFIPLPLCKTCGQAFKPIKNSRICMACHQKNQFFQ